MCLSVQVPDKRIKILKEKHENTTFKLPHFYYY
jgi:hypothetical protein